MTALILIIFTAAVLISAWGLVYYNKTHIMSFREAMDLVELPIVIFYINGNKLNFLLDTGANASIIDKASFKGLPHTKTDCVRPITGMEGNPIEAPVVEMTLTYKDSIYKEEFQVVDMSGAFGAIKQESGVTLNGILGNAFFVRYKYVLDFKELIAYSKK